MLEQNHGFELVLGNKQIFSILFLVILSLGVFFFLGYSTGYDRANLDRDLTTSTKNLIKASPESVVVPDTLLKADPTFDNKLETTSPNNEIPSTRGEKTRIITENGHTSSTGRESALPSSGPGTSLREIASVNGATTIAHSIHLQVAALRVQSDAQLLADKLSAKGYPTSLFSQSGDGWIRVLVGPFDTTDTAKEYRRKLKAEGFYSILRKP